MFIKLHYKDVTALINLLDEMDELSISEQRAFRKLQLMRESMRLRLRDKQSLDTLSAQKETTK